MKNTLKAMILAGLMGAGSFAAAAPAEAQRYRQSGVSVYVATPGVRVGYSRGYYDRYHRWHRYERRHYYQRSRYYHDRAWYWRHRHDRRDYDRRW